MSLFEELYYTEQELKSLESQMTAEVDSNNINIEFQEYLESLPEDIDFSEYMDKACQKLKAITKARNTRYKWNLKRQKETLELNKTRIEKRICYFSTLNIDEYISILKLFNIAHDIVYKAGQAYIYINSVLLEIPYGLVISLYERAYDTVLETPYLLFVPEIKEFILDYMEHKAKGEYVTINGAYQEFMAKDTCKNR